VIPAEHPAHCADANALFSDRRNTAERYRTELGLFTPTATVLGCTPHETAHAGRYPCKLFAPRPRAGGLVRKPIPQAPCIVG
jgi:hypothetical protein